ncbi:MAG: ATP-binding protein, partial [Desulfobacterales bacterium]|nr:ATP-binding protein [Desulfobacterales bacterium]
METKTQLLKDYASQLKLSGIQDQVDELIRQASEDKCSYLDFSLSLLKTEIYQRSQRDLERRTKAAKLPLNHDLDQYDYSFRSGVGKQQLMQLRECQWLEQNFNVVLMGPAGLGKTMIAAGLCFDALKMGYKAYFRTMEQLNETLIMKDITRSALIEYNKLLKANLLVIDD